jgi:LysR family glycine cleavage system transcriptional activator
MSFDHQQWRRLPSLRALAAFAAAGDQGNFSRAAQALFLTQGAVSRQVQRLEQDLGAQLFARHGRRVKLTAEGQRYLGHIEAAFQALSRATDEVRGDSSSVRITVSTLPSFAAKWLSPRLGRFYAQEPDIELRINASRGLVDFAPGDVDLAIRYGPGGWPDVNAERLMSEWVCPVCSPSLVRGTRRSRWRDLIGRTMLLHGDLPETWERWLARAGIANPHAEKGMRFNEDLALMQAAADGLGIALGRSALVERDLSAGLLVEPHDLRLKARYAYWLVTPRRKRPAQVQRFCEWLLSEVKQIQPIQTR